MRTTSSFEIFPDEASERELARARWLRKEGRLAESESAYRGVMQRQPTLRSSWTECFELLRSSGHIDDALQVAVAAESVFPNEAFPLTLKGAALIEMQRFREALRNLEVAVDRDPDLALTWHELGYASFKLGDRNRALLALDRAFALEPHTETLILRGRILRDAGELYAAEVAFEAARHSASHADQLVTIQHEIDVTHRAGAFPPPWIRSPTEGEVWFAEHGAVVIASEATTAPPTEEELELALCELISDRDWSFGQLVTTNPPDRWRSMAARLDVQVGGLADLAPESTPLLLTDRPQSDNSAWATAARRIADEGRGLTAVLRQPLEHPSEADVVCALERAGELLGLSPDASTALVMAQHPVARVASRILSRSATADAG